MILIVSKKILFIFIELEIERINFAHSRIFEISLNCTSSGIYRVILFARIANFVKKFIMRK